VWDYDNVAVSFGEREIDITLAAVAAIELGRESEALWDEHLERSSAGTKPLTLLCPTMGSRAF
jgi:hypothetical protein